MQKLLIPYNNLIDTLAESVQHFLSEAANRENIVNSIFQYYKKSLPYYTINKLIETDTTPRLKLAQWALKLLSQSQSSNVITDTHKLEFIIKSAIDGKFQPFHYKTINGVFKAWDIMQEESDARDDYDVVYDDGVWVAYIPNTYEASRYIIYHLLNSEVIWCTAANNYSGRSHFADYTEDGNHLIIICNKETGELYQWNTVDPGEFKDSDNENVSAKSLKMPSALIDKLSDIADKNIIDETDKSRIYLINGHAYLAQVDDFYEYYYSLFDENNECIMRNAFFRPATDDYGDNISVIISDDSEGETKYILYRDASQGIVCEPINEYYEVQDRIIALQENSYENKLFDLNKNSTDKHVINEIYLDYPNMELLENNKYVIISDHSSKIAIIYAIGVGIITDEACYDENYQIRSNGDNIIFPMEGEDDEIRWFEYFPDEKRYYLCNNQQ